MEGWLGVKGSPWRQSHTHLPGGRSRWTYLLLQAQPLGVGSFPEALHAYSSQLHHTLSQGHQVQDAAESLRPQEDGVLRCLALLVFTPFDSGAVKRGIPLNLASPKGRADRRWHAAWRDLAVPELRQGPVWATGQCPPQWPSVRCHGNTTLWRRRGTLG